MGELLAMQVLLRRSLILERLTKPVFGLLAPSLVYAPLQSHVVIHKSAKPFAQCA
jgi:hypothetical protein